MAEYGAAVKQCPEYRGSIGLDHDLFERVVLRGLTGGGQPPPQ